MISIHNHHQYCAELLYREAGKQNKDGFTALMTAAQVGMIEAVRHLSKVELKMVNKQKRTALMFAAHYDHASCIPLLLGEAGMQDENGNTALMISISQHHQDCTELLYREAVK